MKKIKILLSTIVGLLSVGSVATGFTYAWLSNATTIVDFDHAGGGIISSYFHCGTGTEADPYVITRPVHLYNLVELMYADVTHFQVYDKYFQLGYDLDGNAETLELYKYNDNGVLQEGQYSTVLNMAYYSGEHALLPIGQFDSTNHYAFAGTFDGSGLTVANLEIKGDGTTGIDDLGFFGYVTEDAFIHDFYIDGIKIDVSTLTTGIHTGTETAHVVEVGEQDVPCANVGYIAGHIQSSYSFENVYVNNSEIVGTGKVHITNDWGYFGKCDNAGTLEDFIGHAGDEDPSWGGSVNMQKMYSRLDTIARRATANANYAFEKDIVTKPDGTTFERDKTTGYAYTYRNREEGSFVFTRYNNNAYGGDYKYISGGTRKYPLKQTETTSNNGFTIRSGNGNNARYLGIQNGAIANVQTGWFIDNSNRLAAYVNDTLYFLNHNCQLVTSTTDTWTKSTNTIYYTEDSDWWGTTTYYLTYRNNRWRSYEGGWNTPTLTLTNTTITKIDEMGNGADYMDYSGTNVTYFPLITEDDSYAVGEKNTGYVIGGSQDKTTTGDYPDKTGDIRVSTYGTSNINRSYSNNKLTTVYTINSSLNSVAINKNDFEKYVQSEQGLLESITGGNIYGLHFMSADISKNHLVTAEYALINGEEKTNYKMPASSIDFNLMEKGFINFFAGTYFSGNNSFFSLHHIVRSDSGEISSIREITEIYKSTSTRKPYIYRYGDNTTSGSITSDYSLTFSTARIKRQSSITTNAVYYFEIPVNEGEYALGSVAGGTGAYLMYLDIGTNGGIDYDQDVKTFGKVDFRSAPDVLGTITDDNGQEKELNTMLLITYQQPANTKINLKVVYNKQNNRYDITCTGTIGTITITVLDVKIYVYYNGEPLPQQLVSNIKNVPSS